MNYYIKLLVLSVTFMCLDFGWIIWNRDLYLGVIENIQKSKYEIANILYYIITYTAMLLGLFVICMTFVEVQVQKNKNINKYLVAFLTGGFYGIIVNSIYNFTNLVAYKNYSLYASIVDICWAFVLYGSLSALYVYM